MCHICGVPVEEHNRQEHFCDVPAIDPIANHKSVTSSVGNRTLALLSKATSLYNPHAPHNVYNALLQTLVYIYTEFSSCRTILK